MSSHFETTYRVRAYEAGPQGHATAVTLANYLQSAASDHAQTLGFALEDLAAQNLTWVLHRLRGTIHGTVGWGDDVQVTSWLAGIRKLYGLRDYRLLRPNGKVLVNATSDWLLIDIARRRPVRIPPDIEILAETPKERSMEGDGERLVAPTQIEHRARFSVRHTDLDLNGHVNNVVYLGWVMQTMAPELPKTHRVAAFDLIFRAETLFGTDVVVESEQVEAEDDQQTFTHRVRHEGRDSPVVLAKTTWIPH
ncbi:MAG: thioesterase [Rhodothermales bacterium]